MYSASTRNGSIPACAGEPTSPRIVYCKSGVYPRVCGGTVCPGTGRPESKGLSPRVRGNHAPDPPTGRSRRSIPACAGEPCCRRPPGRRRRVYPRVCGGTVMRLWRKNQMPGLSPRVRGNRTGVGAGALLSGSIPACAGEPPAAPAPAAARRVYPRMCGGTNPESGTFAKANGLSPRVRGNLPDNKLLRALRGSIPACAGEPER